MAATRGPRREGKARGLVYLVEIGKMSINESRELFKGVIGDNNLAFWRALMAARISESVMDRQQGSKSMKAQVVMSIINMAIQPSGT